MNHKQKLVPTHTSQAKASTKGFTLVEMSIVLIIIGLISAGIMTGREMIHNANVMSIITSLNKYKIAINLFQDQYDYLPGDLPNATDYWPGLTVSGNGNGKWDNPIYEGLRAWNQLSLSKLIPESYILGYSYQPDVTIPGTPFSQYSRWHFNTQKITYYGQVLINGNILKVSGGVDANKHWGGGIGPVDAYTIDKKLDDGNSITGNVVGYSSSSTTCINRSSTAGPYLKDRNAPYCELFFKLY